jgi:hypothetical protein
VATGVFFGARVLKKKDLAFAQLGFGSEHGIDSIGCYCFYCNVSNVFGQEWPFCTTDLSHVTVFWASRQPIGMVAEQEPMNEPIGVKPRWFA